MSAPIAYLRREAGVLVAEPPLMPCETCDLAEICGPEYSCPNIDPEEEEDVPEPIHAAVLEYRGDYLTPMTFGSLDELVAYSRANPRDIVSRDDDPDHFYKGGEMRERRKVS